MYACMHAHIYIYSRSGFTLGMRALVTLHWVILEVKIWGGKFTRRRSCKGTGVAALYIGRHMCVCVSVCVSVCVCVRMYTLRRCSKGTGVGAEHVDTPMLHYFRILLYEYSILVSHGLTQVCRRQYVRT
jgi:Mg2+/citrate symporter